MNDEKVIYVLQRAFEDAVQQPGIGEVLYAAADRHGLVEWAAHVFGHDYPPYKAILALAMWEGEPGEIALSTSAALIFASGQKAIRDFSARVPEALDYDAIEKTASIMLKSALHAARGGLSALHDGLGPPPLFEFAGGPGQSADPLAMLIGDVRAAGLAIDSPPMTAIPWAQQGRESR